MLGGLVFIPVLSNIQKPERKAVVRSCWSVCLISMLYVKGHKTPCFTQLLLTHLHQAAGSECHLQEKTGTVTPQPLEINFLAQERHYTDPGNLLWEEKAQTSFLSSSQRNIQIYK